MGKPIQFKRENDEFVIRIPASLESRVLVAIEGPSDVWPTGFFVEQGVRAEIPPAVLSRLAESSVSPASCPVWPGSAQVSGRL